MYQNTIRRPTANRNPNFHVRCSDIAFDERVAFIESVCATLIESRFGPGRGSLLVTLSGRPELEPAAFFDLMDNELVPFYALLPPRTRGVSGERGGVSKGQRKGTFADQAERE